MFWLKKSRRGLCFLAVLAAFSTTLAYGSATLLLEEPYGKLGFFTATGHAAIYLSDVCAETPLKLRLCKSGELGAVISRYDGVGGYDWIAIPLIPYLYAVEKTEDIPLFVDPKTVTFLRDQYRRKHLGEVVADLPNGDTPGGNWYELVGTSYDRTVYAFEIETSHARDVALIRHLNASPNVSHFHTVSHNCADFTKDVINFYYPKALHRSVVADVGITTPKQMAKTLVRFSAKHPRLEFSHYVIPQVPGTGARSAAVHGVVESFFKSKKYIVPSAVASPIFAGCVVAVYIGTDETSRFNPARQSLVYNASRDLEAPVDAEDRRSFQIELNHIVPAQAPETGVPIEKTLAKLLSKGSPGFDSKGHPIVTMQLGDEAVSVGLTQSNLFAAESSPQVAQQILEARLREELRRGNPPQVSESDVERDWKLLERARKSADDQIADQTAKPLPAVGQARWSGAQDRP